MTKENQSEPVTLTAAEWNIMDVVWEKQPCAAGTVQEELQPTHGWAYSTVKTTMDRMVAKGLLVTSSVRNLTLFSAKITKTQAQKKELNQFLRRAFDGAMAPMLQFLVESQELSKEEIAQLRKLISKATPKK